MNKKAAASLGILGTGATATATTLATQGETVENIDDVLQSATLSNGVSQPDVDSSKDKLEDKVNSFWKLQKRDSDSLVFDNPSELFTYTVANDYLDENSSLFGAYNDGKWENTKSFLQINVDRKQYKNGKWRGTLTWSWSFFSDNNKGFVTINKAETADSNNELVLTGGFYVIHKEDSGNSWKVKYRKEIKKDDSSKKILNKSNFNKYFPKPYWYTKQGGFHKYWYSNWGFVGGVGDLDKICFVNEDGCKDTDTQFVSNRSLNFEWAGGKWYDSKCTSWINSAWCDYVWNWSGDINGDSTMQWYDYMYGQIDKNFGLMDHLTPFYRGFWKKVDSFTK